MPSERNIRMTSNARFYIRVRSEETNYNRKKDSKKKKDVHAGSTKKSRYMQMKTYMEHKQCCITYRNFARNQSKNDTAQLHLKSER